MAAFEPGLGLSRAFFRDAVAPLAGDRVLAAGLLGPGSDVLGFDTERSTDHDWGPRCQVFVAAGDVARTREVLGGLPLDFRGWPVLGVEVCTVEDWFERHLGFDPIDPPATLDWLSAPQQLLLEATAGAVFHDPLGVLFVRRMNVAWYPDDVWRWAVACQWRRVAQEEPFVGRAAQVGDHLGARILAARLVRDLVRLVLLLEQRYAPYAKWLGSAFRRLDVAGEIGPLLDGALRDPAALPAALEWVATHHNRRGVSEPVDPAVRRFHDRPFLVLDADRFAAASVAAIDDLTLRSLPPVGTVDQFADSTDVLAHADRARHLATLYRALGL